MIETIEEFALLDDEQLCVFADALLDMPDGERIELLKKLRDAVQVKIMLVSKTEKSLDQFGTTFYAERFAPALFDTEAAGQARRAALADVDRDMGRIIVEQLLGKKACLIRLDSPTVDHQGPYVQPGAIRVRRTVKFMAPKKVWE